VHVAKTRKRGCLAGRQPPVSAPKTIGRGALPYGHKKEGSPQKLLFTFPTG